MDELSHVLLLNEVRIIGGDLRVVADGLVQVVHADQRLQFLDDFKAGYAQVLVVDNFTLARLLDQEP